MQVTDAILVIGAGGFIGQHLVRALAQRGNPIIAADRCAMDFRLANVQTHIGELREPEDFLPLIARSRTVVYLASTSTPASSIGEPIAEFVRNLYPMRALLQVLPSRPEIDLIHLSSGGSLYAVAENESAGEDGKVAPRSYHGAGKVATEHFVSAWCAQYSSAATIVRPSNIYGPGQHERKNFAIVPTAFGKILNSETLTVRGDGSAIRDYLYIDDFVTLLIDILAAPVQTGVHIINASTGVGTSLDQLFGAMETVTGRQLLRKYNSVNLVDADRTVINSALAKQRYGWSSTTCLQDGLRRTWDWLTTTPR